MIEKNEVYFAKVEIGKDNKGNDTYNHRILKGSDEKVTEYLKKEGENGKTIVFPADMVLSSVSHSIAEEYSNLKKEIIGTGLLDDGFFISFKKMGNTLTRLNDNTDLKQINNVYSGIQKLINLTLSAKNSLINQATISENVVSTEEEAITSLIEARNLLNSVKEHEHVFAIIKNLESQHISDIKNAINTFHKKLGSENGDITKNRPTEYLVAIPQYGDKFKVETQEKKAERIKKVRIEAESKEAKIKAENEEKEKTAVEREKALSPEDRKKRDEKNAEKAVKKAKYEASLTSEKREKAAKKAREKVKNAINKKKNADKEALERVNKAVEKANEFKAERKHGSKEKHVAEYVIVQTNCLFNNLKESEKSEEIFKKLVFLGSSGGSEVYKDMITALNNNNADSIRDNIAHSRAMMVMNVTKSDDYLANEDLVYPITVSLSAIGDDLAGKVIEDAKLEIPNSENNLEKYKPLYSDQKFATLILANHEKEKNIHFVTIKISKNEWKISSENKQVSSPQTAHSANSFSLNEKHTLDRTGDGKLTTNLLDGMYDFTKAFKPQEIIDESNKSIRERFNSSDTVRDALVALHDNNHDLKFLSEIVGSPVKVVATFDDQNQVTSYSLNIEPVKLFSGMTSEEFEEFTERYLAVESVEITEKFFAGEMTIEEFKKATKNIVPNNTPDFSNFVNPTITQNTPNAPVGTSTVESEENKTTQRQNSENGTSTKKPNFSSFSNPTITPNGSDRTSTIESLKGNNIVPRRNSAGF
jgi:hypothetical protein